jgi:Domain of unknown function (DUF4034)
MNTNTCSARLLSHRALIGSLICGVCWWSAACGHTHAFAPVDRGTVMRAVETYGKGHAVTAVKTEPAATTGATDSKDPAQGSSSYQAHVAIVLSEEKFDELEKEAQKWRTSKVTVEGGLWRLAQLYDGVSNPPLKEKSTDADWETHFASLAKWVAKYPASATARIATAEAYVNYAWVARGTGYAEKVKENGWELFGERLEKAKSTLMDAAELKEKCPEWYSVMFNVALGDGWDKKQARELFDQAVAFEPGFLFYYNQYAYFILPKWYGEEGEAQAFAEESSKQVGGAMGSIIYFEVAGETACQCDKDRDSMEQLSWAKIKEGYANLKKVYGASNQDDNKFAYMAYSQGDKPAALEAFETIGNAWSYTVWRSGENYDGARAWATGP